MTNTTTTAVPTYTFIYDSLSDNPNLEVYVVKSDSIQDITRDEERDQYGQPCGYNNWEGSDEEWAEIAGDVIGRGFKFWDGSNHRTTFIESEETEPRFYAETDENLIAEYTKAIEEMEFEGDRNFTKTWLSGDYKIQQSGYDWAWVLYTIRETDEDSE